MLRRPNTLMAILALTGILSCVDPSDYRIDQIDLTPSVALPLVTGSFAMSDLLDHIDATHVKVYPDGLVYFVYHEELESDNITDMFGVPDKSVTFSFLLPAVTLPPTSQDLKSDSISRVVDFGMGPEKIDEVKIKTGQVSYSTSIVPASANVDYEIRLSMPTFKSAAGVPLNTTMRGTGSIDLKDYTMGLDDNRFSLKAVLVIRKHNSSATIPPGATVNFSLSFRDIEFSYLKGFFGEQTTTLSAQKVDLDNFGDMFEGAVVSAAQPKVSISIRNENGVPCVANFSLLEARKEDASPLQILLNPANPVSMNFPTVMGQAATTVVNIANVNDLIGYSPTSIHYQVGATINKGLTSGENFIVDTSRMRVDFDVEVPMYGHASNIRLVDTLDMNLEEQENSEVLKAALKLKIVNEMPLEGQIQFYLMNEDYDFLALLLETNQVSLLRGSEVNASGDLVKPGVYDGSIELTQEKVKNLFKSKHLIVEMIFQTSRNSAGGPQDVKFKADQTISIDAGILADLKLKLK
jgi:hypothetical protein